MLTLQKILGASSLLLIQPALALIHYDGDDTGNLAAPDIAREDIFNSVGRISGANRGSVVHIRGKYLLTANHVNVNTNSVTFDGITFWERDTQFAPMQIGSADMKLIKLVEDPVLPETLLYDGIIETLSTATLVAWGVGKDANVTDSGLGSNNVWQWGNSGTMAKRWGTNQIAQASTGVIAGYTYDHLVTYLNRNAGNNEAAATLYDSGSGLFIQDGGTWKLAGLTTAITSIDGPTDSEPNRPYNSTFGSGNNLTSDRNFFVRISSYAGSIESAIPDISTYAGWKTDHSLSGSDATDTDNDGIGQLLEFAFGGDPNVSQISILPTHQLIEDTGSTYLEITLTRPINLQGIIYTPQTTTDLSSWPTDSTGILNASPTPIDHGDGTETLTYRRSLAVAGADQAFIRIDVSE